MGFKKCLFVAIALALINLQIYAMEVESVQDHLEAIYDTHRKCFYPCVILIHFHENFQLPEKICKNITTLIALSIFHHLELYFNNATKLPILHLPIWDRDISKTITKNMLQQVAETLVPENPYSKEAYAIAESTIRNHYFTHYFFLVVEDLLQFFSLDVAIQILINCLSNANIKLEDVSFHKKYSADQACANQKDFLRAEIIVCLKVKSNVFGSYYLPTEKRVNYTIIDAKLSRNTDSGNDTVTIITSVSKKHPKTLKRLSTLDF